MKTPEFGFYYHCKRDPNATFNNCAYEFFGLAKHTEDETIMALYRPLYDSEWMKPASSMVRPLEMFLGEVTKEGKTFPRFQRVTDQKAISRLIEVRDRMYGDIANKKLIAESQADYELIATGQNCKLERYGQVVLARPDPQALWLANLNSPEWLVADATFKKTDDSEEKGEWKIKRGAKVTGAGSATDGGDVGVDGDTHNLPLEIDSKWQIEYGGLKMQIKLSPFKHTGLFPEQIINWQWMEKIVSRFTVSPNTSLNTSSNASQNTKPKILNLFGYTGGASLICAKAGAEVTHVDASKSAINWANENQKLSGLEDKPIRWILEDAAEFVKRELRRGSKYDGIIMDPPAFGRGAKGEIWKIENDFLPLVENCLKLLSDKPLFFVLNGYSAGYSSVAYARNLQPLVDKFGGEIEHGELCIAEGHSGTRDVGESATRDESKLLPCGIVARWKA